MTLPRIFNSFLLNQSTLLVKLSNFLGHEKSPKHDPKLMSAEMTHFHKEQQWPMSSGRPPNPGSTQFNRYFNLKLSMKIAHQHQTSICSFLKIHGVSSGVCDTQACSLPILGILSTYRVYHMCTLYVYRFIYIYMYVEITCIYIYKYILVYTYILSSNLLLLSAIFQLAPEEGSRPPLETAAPRQTQFVQLRPSM